MLSSALFCWKIEGRSHLVNPFIFEFALAPGASFVVDAMVNNKASYVAHGDRSQRQLG